MKFLRRLLEDPRAVDSVVVVLATWFLLGGYVTAYAYVHVQGQVLQPAAQAGQTVVAAAWSLLTLYLFAGFATGLRAGRVWNRALRACWLRRRSSPERPSCSTARSSCGEGR